jgi:hypothetical protein
MGGENYGKKDVVVDNAKFFVSNRRFLGAEGPGSHNTKTRNTEDTTADTTRNNENTAAETGYDDHTGRSFRNVRGNFQL